MLDMIVNTIIDMMVGFFIKFVFGQLLLPGMAT